QAVPLLRRRAQRLGERQVLGGGQGELAGLAPEERPLHAHEVAEVGDLEALELVAERVLLHVNLELAAPVAELDERRLAEAPERHHPAGDGVAWLRGLQLLGGVRGVLLGDVAGEVRRMEPVAEGVGPQRAPAAGLLQALLVQLVLLRRFGLVAHGLSEPSPTPERPGWGSSRRGAGR